MIVCEHQLKWITSFLILINSFLFFSCNSTNESQTLNVISIPVNNSSWPEDSKTTFIPGEELNDITAFNIKTRMFSEQNLGLVTSIDLLNDTVVYQPNYADFNDSYIFLFDYPVQKIKKINYDGELVNSMGGQGRGPGEFTGGFGLRLDNDNRHIYVSDFSEARVTKFDFDGNLLNTIPTNNANRLAILGSNKIAQDVSNSDKMLRVLDHEGSILFEFGNFIQNQESSQGAMSPILTDDNQNNFYVAFTYAGYIAGYNQYGERIFLSHTMSHPGYLPYIINTDSFRFSSSDYVISWDISYDREKLYVLGGHVEDKNNDSDSHDDSFSHSIIDVYSAIDGIYQYSFTLSGYYQKVQVRNGRLLAFHPEMGKMKIWDIN